MYPQQKTHETFLEEVLLKNKYYANGEFIIIGKYKRVKDKILLQNKYSFHEMTPDGLLRGSNVSVHSSTNKILYCNNILLELGINLELVNVDNLKKVYYNTIYGLCCAPFDRLKRYIKPTIHSAVDKTDFMKREFEEVHADKYDYTLSIYKNANEKIEIICKKHGLFKQGYPKHKEGTNCPTCSLENASKRSENNGGWGIKDWCKKASTSKKFDSFKFYIIKCWNNYEEFYKIGRTFVKLTDRFPCKEQMPYSYEIVQIRESEDAMKIYYLEKVFKKFNEKYKYKPQISFNGKQECFTKIIDINNGKEIK